MGLKHKPHKAHEKIGLDRKVLSASDYKKQWRWKTQYGLSKDDVEDFWTKQEGKCGLCFCDLIHPFETGPVRASKDILKTVIDHDHKTGKARGLLCNNCNIFLGTLESHKLGMEEIIRRMVAWISN